MSHEYLKDQALFDTQVEELIVGCILKSQIGVGEDGQQGALLELSMESDRGRAASVRVGLLQANVAVALTRKPVTGLLQDAHHSPAGDYGEAFAHT